MAKLAEVYFRLRIRIDDADLLKLQRSLEEAARKDALGLFHQDAHIEVDLASGSLRGRVRAAGRIAAAVAIGYGGLRNTIDYLVQDARKFNEAVTSDVRNLGVSEEEIERVERRLGVPGQLQKVFNHLDRLETEQQNLTPKEYQAEVRAIRDELLDVVRQLDDPLDRELLHKAMPAIVREASHEPRPSPQVDRRRPVALRPKEYERGTARETLNAAKISARMPPEEHKEPEYRVVETPGGIRLERKYRR